MSSSTGGLGEERQRRKTISSIKAQSGRTTNGLRIMCSIETSHLSGSQCFPMMQIVIKNAKAIRIPIKCKPATGCERSFRDIRTNIEVTKKRFEPINILSGSSQRAKPAVIKRDAQTNCFVVIGSGRLFFESVI